MHTTLFFRFGYKHTLSNMASNSDYTTSKALIVLVDISEYATPLMVLLTYAIIQCVVKKHAISTPTGTVELNSTKPFCINALVASIAFAYVSFNRLLPRHRAKLTRFVAVGCRDNGLLRQLR